ncbi:MAG: Dyp-type peroxidase [Alphaproteobacteria bacterium]|nr:Dyp-type peroxidase [Alphaproteobacteria bacterium]
MVAAHSQPGILEPCLPVGRSLAYRVATGGDPRPALARLQRSFDPSDGVVGLGAPLVAELGCAVPGLRVFPAMSGPGTIVPSTQNALWVMLRGADRSEVFDRSWSLTALLGGAFEVADVRDTFVYRGGHDLTGYEDGTENPKGDAAVAAAICAEGGPGRAGSSFVAVQRWVHDLKHFHGHLPEECDHMIGRRRDGNEEIEDAPPTAHVKVSAQESYDPAAYMVRRSMPWVDALHQGLEFIAYGASFDPYERVMRRMAGLDGGAPDALFRFSRPVTGGYYWCPPVDGGGRLDLSRLGL